MTPPSRRASLLVRALLPWLAVAAASCGDGLDPDRTAVESVAIAPSDPSVVAGSTVSLTATARDAAGAVLTGRRFFWSSEQPSVATVNGNGVVTGVAAGSTRIAATAEGKSAVVTVTVSARAVASVRVTPADRALRVGETAQLTAEALDAQGGVLAGRAVQWSTSNAGAATVSAAGLVTAVAPGGATITATSEGRSGIASVTVSLVPVAAVIVTPDDVEIRVGATHQLTAVTRDASGRELTGRSVTWSTSDPGIATVSSSGLVTGVATGGATITATSEGQQGTSAVAVQPSAVANVTLSPPSVTVTVGQTASLTPQLTDDRGTVLTGRPVTWASEQATIASVSDAGVVTGVAPGTTRIRATSEGRTGTADVIVTSVPVDRVDVAPSTASLFVGRTRQLAATPRAAGGAALTGRQVTWSTGAPSVATVSASGVVTAVGAGTALVFASSEGKTGSATITVTDAPVGSVSVSPTTATLAGIAPAPSVQLTATVRDEDGNVITRPVVWTEEAGQDFLRVNGSGVVVRGPARPLLPVQVVVSASSGGKVGTATITVSPL